jgi:hypothetical protein
MEMQRGVLAGVLLVASAAGAWAFVESLEEALYVPPDHPAIQYSKQAPNDPVARLAKKIESGQVKLDYAANALGYLPALLKQLDVPVDSQLLVFSKGSIQAEHISPRTPRAIYFNDDVAIGYVQNGDALELTGLDPVRGMYFYTLDTPKAAKIEFGRRPDCLRCHEGPPTLAVPGLMVSSVHPRTDAREGHGSSFITDDRVPIGERWGGWYVTGTTGAQTDYGNNIALVDPLHPGDAAAKEVTQNQTSLAAFLDTSRYLAPTSDIVALMTLEHQTRMTNLLVRIGWDARIGLYDKEWDDAQMNSEIEQMVTYMLFANEAPLKGPVTGVSTFAKTFATRGPRDRQGRSLRDFDLKTRLFRYPLSYMIYSAAFDNLPDKARDLVYQRLYDVLSGKDRSKTFARLSAEDRAAVLEIMRQTKSNLPAYWGSVQH